MGADRVASAKALLGAAGWGSDRHPLVVAAAEDRDGLVELLRGGLGGAAAVVVASPDPIDGAVLDDLRRLWTVDDWRGAGPTHPVDALGEVQIRLLAHLADGASTNVAARAVHLSVRSAHRRVAETVAALGDPSSTAALGRVSARLRELGPAHRPSAPSGLVGRKASVEAILASVGDRSCTTVTGERGVGTTAVLLSAAEALGVADRVVRSLELVDDPVAFARLADPAVGTESPAVLAARIVRADPRPIVIDDARLLGGQARDLLLALAGEVPLIVGGLARDEPLLAMLEERCRPTSIDLGPLPAADAAALARRYGARGDDVVADIIALAGGYPERLAVLARNPDDVDHSAEQAIRQIRTDARLAAEAALVGLALAPLPETALSADAVEALDHSRLIVRRDGMVSAAGPVTRRVLESLATDVAANAAHRRLADAVVDDVARAEHLLLAGDRAEAHRIARSSLAGAPTPAGRARILAVAARSAEHGAEGVALVDAAARAILATESLRAARAFLAEVLEAHPELEARPAIVALDAGLRIQDGLADSARTRLDRALATRGLERAEEVRLRAIRWGLDLASGGDREVLRTDADALGPVLADEAPDLTSRMLPGISLAMQGDATWPNHLLPVLADAIARAGEEPGSSDLLLALGSEVVGFLLGAYGDLQGAVDVLARSIVALRATGSDALASDLEVMRAYTSIAVRGPDDAGLAVLRAAIPRASSVRQRCAGLAVLAQSEADRGALELAMASLERARREPDDPIGSDAITQARATVAWTGGEPARALEILGAESGGAGSFSLLPLQRWALQAWAHLDLGTTAVPEDRPVVY
ncbi:MAG: hypothetical protein KDA94_05395, partial [Acidimicrobiales bacterium]|nr:hypothetical protein [Acidimicrobiales bacterium]